MIFNQKKGGFTLVDVLVGIFLLVLISVGIYGGYQVVMKSLAQAKMRTIAFAICNEKIENFRNLTYDKVGIQGGYPSGDIPDTETVVSNNISFTVNNKVDYVADESDGLAAPDDSCPNDYKRVTVTVSWGSSLSHQISLSTNIAPENEVQECEETGGILWANVFDAYGSLIDNALVDVKDINSTLEKQCQTSLTKRCYIILPDSGSSPENYKITVSKDGYSQEETFKSGDSYGSNTITTPEKPNATILEGQLTKISFSIDKLSGLSIETRSSRGREEFLDDFTDSSKVSELSHVSISGGEATLAKSDGDYFSSGYLISKTISSPNLVSWGDFSFSDSKPDQTNINYQVFYFTTEEVWDLIPDSDLPGNSTGFSTSPVDLSSLDASQYSQIRLKANFSTSDLSQTPSLLDWQVIYFTKESHLIGDVPFHLQGGKVVGYDADSKPIYKYSEDLTSDDTGHLAISNLEWDNYHFSSNASTGMNLVEVDPPQPVELAPDTSQSVALYFEAEDSLLVIVKDIDTGDPILDAPVRVYNSNYDKTYQTDSKGEVYFAPLDIDTYNVDVSAQGYDSYEGTVTVSGETTKEIDLTLSPQ